MSRAAPDMVRLDLRSVGPLHAMLEMIEAAGEARWFRPHPFTPAYLEGLCGDGIADLHYVLRMGNTALAYGLLRGWDEGYDVPSLGVAVHPHYRGKGLGASAMHFLHGAARLRGSPRIRLRVDRANEVATALYRGMGYQFDEAIDQADDDRLLTGFKELSD